MVNKSDISGFINNSNLDKKIKLQTYDSSLFIGQSYFINDGSHNFLIFQQNFSTFTIIAGLTETIVAWKSKRL